MGRYTGKKCRLLTMFTMTASFFLVELIVGYITNSMALVADSFHMLSDVLALVIAFLGVKMSPKKWSKNTFGWARAEVLGALVNSVFLLALCFSIFVESLKRLYETEELHNPQLILVVGVIGLVVNLIGLGLFHEHGHGHSHGGGGHGHSHGGHGHKSKLSTINTLVATDDNENDERFTPPPPNSVGANDKHGNGTPRREASAQMNMRGVFLHVLSDALGSVIVIISALVVWLTEWEYSKYIDPALSLGLVTLITCSTWPLLKDSALILLQTVPTHIQVDGIQKQLLNVDGVLAVHEFHVWQLAGERIIASAHIRCRNLKDYMVLAEKIKKMFHEEGIHSTTIQPEFVEYEDDGASASIDSAEDCILDCPSKDKDGCVANTCCGLSKQVKSDSNKELRLTNAKKDGSPSTFVKDLPLQQNVSFSLPDISKVPSACYPQWTPPGANDNASHDNASAVNYNCNASVVDSNLNSAQDNCTQIYTITDSKGNITKEQRVMLDSGVDLNETYSDSNSSVNQRNTQNRDIRNDDSDSSSYASSVSVAMDGTDSDELPASVRL
nr:zinc/cadmium resistance protein-like [Penaeus vannamei]XP_027214332.1 zinc/cadmium resistance protein-like [Penaeus vannamei]XP_027214339.1 zinc/cadmium resistance protein-like [Penaeus vannamei]XP_027214347.1 zinc/cadmium resistance protein-like [Penaeus vannamei]